MRIRLLFILALLALTAASRVHAEPQEPQSSIKIIPRTNTKRQPPLPKKIAGPRVGPTGPALSAPSQPRLASNIAPQPRVVAADQGNVSVLQDDGTLIIPYNPFNLSNSSLTFTPQGSGYTVQSVTPTYVNPGSATQLAELGGGSAQVTLGFNFPFYGVTYKTAYLNSYGNLTFGAVDDNDFYLDIRTVMSGPPRIAALFDSLVDQFGGGYGEIGVEGFSDHMNFYWAGVEDQSGEINTFEISIYNTGVININYGAVGDPSYTSAVVGVSQGGTTSFTQGLFSQQTSALSFTGTIGEVFSPYTDIDLGAVGFAFYQSHPDNYDGYIAFADIGGLDFADGFPYAQQVSNETTGLNTYGSNGLFDGVSFFGSKSRLFIAGDAGSISQYPSDPTQIFLGPHSTNTLMGQLFGHAWMSYVDTNPSSLLGLSGLWSFTMDGQGSVMEGNLLNNLGNGQFQTVNADYQYSPLDRYLMGLLPPASVPNWYVVTNPTLTSAPSDFSCTTFGPACYAEIGVQFSGTAQAVTIQNVISNVGARSPSSTSSQKNFNLAFILVTPQGQAANPQSVAQLSALSAQWPQWFATATGNLGTVSTNLTALAPTISSVSPNQGPTLGDSAITITGTNFQGTSAVTFGGNAGTVISATSTSLQVVVPPNSSATTTSIVVTNPDGQNATSTYTYTSGPLSQLQVTLASSGSLHTVSAGTAATAQVGYAMTSPATSLAILQSYTNGVLASEAAVAPEPAATQWTMYAEYQGAGFSTGVAIANPGSTAANLTLTLSNGSQTTLQLAAGAQHAAFVNQLFTNLAAPFLGTMSVQSNTPVSIVTLRGTTNQNGQFIISTVPVSSGTPNAGGFVAFPVVSDGGGYNTDIILVNYGTTTSSGTLQFSSSVATNLGTNSGFQYTIPAGGLWEIQTSGTPATVTNGWAAMSATATSPMPSATAVIRYSSGANLISETSVPAQNNVSSALMFGSYETSLSTGIALLNLNAQPVQVTLTPLNGAGQPVLVNGVNLVGTVTVPAFTNVTEFLNQIIPALPLGYEGTVMVQTASPIYAVSVRGTTNSNGFLLSTTPVLDTTVNYSGTYYFPQVADGGGYTTEFLMMNAGSGNVQLQFYSTTGQPLALLLH